MSAKIMGLIYDLELGDPTLKAVAVAYADHADQEGRNIFPSVATVSKKTELSERTVQRKTKDLVAIGLFIPDGKGRKGTNKWRVNMKMLMRQSVTPTENAQKATRGVTDSTKRGAPESPEPSIEPSVVNHHAKNPKDVFRAHAEQFFKDKTHLPIPKRKSEAGTLWYTPLREMCEIADWDKQRLEYLITKSLDVMQGLTVSSPNSIIKVFRAESAKAYTLPPERMSDEQFRKQFLEASE